MNAVVWGRTLDSWIDDEDYRIMKALYLGDDDVRTADESGPFGIDSNCPKDFVAVYARSHVRDEPVVVGYIFSGKIAGVGETRVFSVKDDKSVSQYIWLKNDGTMEVGGDADNMVRYSKLEEAYNQLKADHDTVVQDLNDLKNVLQTALNPSVTVVTEPGNGAPSAFQLALQSAFTSYVGATLSDSTGDITPAKIDEIKTS